MEYFFEIHYKMNTICDAETRFQFGIVAENEQKAQRAAYAVERQICKDNPWFAEAEFIMLKRI